MNDQIFTQHFGVGTHASACVLGDMSGSTYVRRNHPDKAESPVGTSRIESVCQVVSYAMRQHIWDNIHHNFIQCCCKSYESEADS